MKIYYKYCCILIKCLFILPLNSQIIFQENALASGINHTYTFGQSGGGISFVDFNNDGLDDLSIGTAKGDLIHFYKNTGNGFVRNLPLVGNATEQKQIFWVDYDNDGDKDLFVCAKGDVNRLYQNDGDLKLTDVTSASLLPMHQFLTFNACWADFNRDGWLDLYVCERMDGDQANNRNYMFFNNADGTFTDVSESSSSMAEGKLPFCSSTLDYDKDKWPDLFVVNDRGWGNVMLHNEGNGVFMDKSIETNTAQMIDGMSIGLGDYNNDSWTDIYVTNTPSGNLLLKNSGIHEGNIVFSNLADSAGVSFNGTAWGANFLDADNDMDLDIYVSGSDLGSNQNSSAFYNQIRSDSFDLVKEGFEGDTVISYANAIGDFNNDGYADIFTLNYNGTKSFLYKNMANGNNYIKIKLEGVKSNKDGIGSSIYLYSGGKTQYYYTHSGVGFMAQNSENYSFGAGSSEVFDSIRIEWSSGHVDKLFNQAVNQNLTIVEGATTSGNINIDSDIEIKTSDFPSNTEDENRISLKLYPVPAINFLSIRSEFHFTNYNIKDYLGRIVLSSMPKQQNSNEKQIDISTLHSGIYFIEVFFNNNKRETMTFLKY